MGLPRNVKVLSAVSFFQDTASEMLYPILPLFITGTLGAPPAVLGLIEGVAEGTASVMKAASGRWSDVRRRKPLVAAGYTLSGASKPLIALAFAWPLVLVARFSDRVGKGLRTSPRDALIIDDTPSELRGRAFGFHRAADTAGAVAGPLLGLALYELLRHRIRRVFAFAAIPGLISATLVVFVREHTHTRPTGDAFVKQKLGRPYWTAVVPITIFGLVNFSDAFLILRAKQLGLGFVAVIVVYALYNVSYAALSYPAGWMADRAPKRFVFAAGLVVFAAAYVGLGLVARSAWVWLLLPLYGGYTALTDGVGKAWVSDLMPREARGWGIGLFHGLSGLASLVAGVWAGVAWGSDGRLPLLVAGAVSLAVAAWLALAPSPAQRHGRGVAGSC